MERRQDGASSDWKSCSKTFQRRYVEKTCVGQKKSDTSLEGKIKIRTFISLKYLTVAYRGVESEEGSGLRILFQGSSN